MTVPLPPSNFRAAVREMVADERVCPKCAAMNIRGAAPTIVVDERNEASCNQCGHGWLVKET